MNYAMLKQSVFTTYLRAQ